jgi:hypothetical protein
VAVVAAKALDHVVAEGDGDEHLLEVRAPGIDAAVGELGGERVEVLVRELGHLLLDLRGVDVILDPEAVIVGGDSCLVAIVAGDE